MNLSNVLDENGCTTCKLDRDIVEVVDRGRDRIGADRELGIADLGKTRRHGQVLGVDGVHHIDRRQALGLELEEIKIDHDLSILAARGRRQRDSMNGRELLA